MKDVTYKLRFKDGREYVYAVDIERPYRENDGTEHAAWTRLDCCRCENCPLPEAEYTYCPAALDIEKVAEHFRHTLSIERADVWVQTEQRTYFKNCDAQTYLNSLFGLIMASSECPILKRLKPLAYFHLPFASIGETAYRLIGTYHISQHIKAKQDASYQPDWELTGVHALSKQLKIVNVSLMKRVRTAALKDASVNAVQSFVSRSLLGEMGIDTMIESIAPILKDGL